MRIVLHVGNEKTGTTALQNYFAKNYSNPIASAYYPFAGRRQGEYHHHLLYEDLIVGQSETVGAYLDRELAEVGAEIVIISCELFSFLSPASTEALRNFAIVAEKREWDVQMVAVVREARPFLKSLYLEGLNWGRTEDFGLFVQRHLRRLRAGLLQQTALDFGWSTTFLRYDPENLLSSFKREVGLPLSENTNLLARANTSIPPWMAPFLLTTNRMFGNPGLTRAVRDLVMAYEVTPPSDKNIIEREFFALTKELEEAIKEVEKEDPIRSVLFPQNIS